MSSKLTINDHTIEVEDGMTILAAAKQLGIEIPTLCHLDGVEPFTSCFLCVVEVEGRRNLVPSCTAPVEEGMVVVTDSDEVRAARKMALELLLSDHRGDCLAPCMIGCPAGLDIPGFIRHILAGEHGKALTLIRERIPLPGALGRICPRFCERVCRRREQDEPIAVCALKRFPADKKLASGEASVPPRAAATGKRVAIVGAGPAGLSAAYHLLRQGHDGVVFDANPEPGGLFRYGLPEFRLPKAVLDGDLEPIRRLGAEFRMNTRLGTDVGLDELRSDFDAVLLAMGAQAGRSPEWHGAENARPALEFLRAVSEGERPDVGSQVVVVGGGYEAVAAARTALRLGAAKVTLVWEKTRKAMPCFSEYVDAAEAEGVNLELEMATVCLEAVAGGQLKLRCSRGDDETVFDASCVIAAPVRQVDTSAVAQFGLDVSKKGLAVNPKTLAAKMDGVFAAGEVVSGATDAIRVVSAGRLAAVSINQYLTGETPTGEARPLNVRLGNLDEAEKAELFREFPKHPRVQPAAAASATSRTSFDEVQRGLSDEQARKEAARCLQCDCVARDDCKLRQYAVDYGAEVSQFKGERRRFERDTSHPDIVYEPGKCIACSLCVRISTQEQDQVGMTFTQRGFTVRTGVPFGGAVADGLSHSAKECVAACPTGALTLRRAT